MGEGRKDGGLRSKPGKDRQTNQKDLERFDHDQNGNEQ